VQTLVRELSRAGILIALNPSSYLLEQGQKVLAPILKMSDVIFVNRNEASLLTGIPASQTKKVFTRLDELVRGIAVMTDSARGAIVSDGARMFAGKTFNARVVDATGAGDAFGGAFVAGLIESREVCGKRVCSEEAMTYALRRASANAASVVEHFGATDGILTKKEFLNNKRWKEYPIKITHL
jgi:ribokinase